LTESEISLNAKIAAYASWANTEDREVRTRKARQAFEDKFLTEAGGDVKRAEALRRAYFLKMAKKSAQTRRRRGGAA
jgi:hypothetical protein